jgi:hypothetical protein
MADTEPDTETDEGDDSTAGSNQGKRTITLTAGEQSVYVEGPDDLATLAELAAYFWLLVSPPQKVAVGFTAGTTLVTERSAPHAEADEDQLRGCLLTGND